MSRKAVLLALTVLIFVAGCRSEWSSQPYFKKLIARFAAGNPPDIAYMDTLRIPEYIDANYLMPLSEFEEELELDEFYPQLLENFQRDGETYAVPHDFQTDALIINTDLFDEVGLERPDDNWTWDDLREAAEVIGGSYPEVYGIGLTTTMANWLPFVYQAGGELLDESGIEMALYSEESVEALDFYSELAQQPIGFYPQMGAPCESVSWPYLGLGCLTEMFANGQLGMLIADPAWFNRILYLYAEQGIDDPPVKVVRLPIHPGTELRTTIAYVVGYGLTTEPTAARVDFLRFATSEDAMRLWYLSDDAPVEFIPARMALAGEWVEAFAGDSDAARSGALTFLESVEDIGRYQPDFATSSSIADFDRQADQKLLEALNGEIEVEAAVLAIDELGAEILAESQ